MPRFPRRSYSTRLARHLRSRITEPELRLWTCLHHDFPHKCRRQEPLGPYICDFVCHSHRLVVEVDGIQHLDSPHDEQRDRELRRMGFRVERVWNGDVMTDLDSVIEQIAAALDDRRPIHRHQPDRPPGQHPLRRRPSAAATSPWRGRNAKGHTERDRHHVT